MSDATTTPTVPAGAALRRARELTGLSERSAARELGVRRGRLRDWERDRSAPDGDELARAITLYSQDLDRIWPDRQPLVSPDEPGVLVVGDERIVLTDLARIRDDGVDAPDNRVVLTRYLAAVRRQRGVAPDAPVELRASDLASLAWVLDLADVALESELAELLDLTPAGARWTARALVVGSLMALGATALAGTAWIAPVGASTSVEAAAPAAATVFAPEVAPTTQVSARATVQFAPAEVDPDAPVEAEVVADPATNGSPFSTEPGSTPVELAPAVFATAPATEWTQVDDDATAAVIETSATELPPA